MRDWMQSRWWGAYQSGVSAGLGGQTLCWRTHIPLKMWPKGCGGRMFDAAYLYGYRAGVRERKGKVK